MSASAPPDSALCYLNRGEETTGPYTVAQVRAMWERGTIMADTRYCLDGGGRWEPILALMRPSAETQVTQAKAQFLNASTGCLLIAACTVGLIFCLILLAISSS